jgi:hypothetical protein
MRRHRRRPIRVIDLQIIEIEVAYRGQVCAAPRAKSYFDRTAAAVMDDQAKSAPDLCYQGVGAFITIRMMIAYLMKIIGHSFAAILAHIPSPLVVSQTVR